MDKKKKPERPASGFVSVPLRLSSELEEKIAKASEKTKLAKQDVMRLSLERGIDILVDQLTKPVVPAAA